MKSKGTIKKILTFTFFASLISAVILSVVSCMDTSNLEYINIDEIELVQFNEVEDGDPIAIISTSVGEIRAVLYPEYAPESVKRFTELAESGYYDGTYVFNIVEDVYFAAGSPDNTGSIENAQEEAKVDVPVELHQNLWPFKGAICAMPNDVDVSFWDYITGDIKKTSNSKIMVLNTVEMNEDIKQGLLEVENGEKLANAFIEEGGIPNYSQQLTVFAQTYEGFDVIEKITAEKTFDNNGYHTPKEDIIIESITISTYKE